MKKLIFKTALITFATAIVCWALFLVILSFSAPKIMMDLTASLGMEGISGNYAYEEWERSGDLDCLTRSFLIAANHGEDDKALARFDALTSDQGFEYYCLMGGPKEEDVGTSLPAYSFRDFLMGTGARVKYRLASTEEEKAAVLAFALSETKKEFTDGNPVVALCAEATEKGDAAFLSAVYDALTEGGFEHSGTFERLISTLEGSHDQDR